jgi:hypothetical protein
MKKITVILQEKNVKVNSLPENIQTAIENSIISSWHVDDAIKACLFALRLVTAPFIIAIVHP